MKTKNVFLAVIAFTFAVGSAFASMLVADPVYVWAKRTQLASPTCVQTNKTCTQTTDTGKICQIEISVTKPGVGTQIAFSSTSSANFRTFDESSCSVVLYDNADLDQTGALPFEGSIYELVAH